MQLHLFDSELRLMELLWEMEPVSAKELSLLAADRLNWNKNTTYTLINRCIKKGAIERSEPNFLCRALISRDRAQAAETDELIDKLYGGSAFGLFASLLGRNRLTREQLDELKDMVNKMK